MRNDYPACLSGTNLTKLQKSQESTHNVMPANPGFGPGQAPASRNIRWLQKKDTGPRLSPRVTTSYESVKLGAELLEK